MDNLLSILSYIPKILSAMPTTILILGVSLLLSLIIGLLIALAALSKSKGLNIFAKQYIAFMRGIPTLVLMFLIYLALPQFVRGLGGDMSGVAKEVYIIACLSLSTSANMAEMMRSSYLSVDKGQREAAYSVGMSGFTALRRIVFPQAFGVAIPTLGNNIIMLFKETSLAFTIGVMDILGEARVLTNASYGANRVQVYIATGLIFWAICFALEKGTKFLEKMYTKGRKSAVN
jgi:L-cystine transport system permease protein